MLDVYLDPCTINCRKVLAGLQLVGADYNEKKMNYFNGDHKSEDYKKINPCATVPAAVDGDCTITESNAIMAYAADVKGSEYYPKDLKQRAICNKWLLWEASAWFGACYTLCVQNIFMEKPDDKVMAEAVPNFHKCAAVLEHTLSKSKWVCGDQLTIADIAVASPMHISQAAKLPLEKYPGIQRWYKDIEALPAWKNTQAPVDAMLSGSSPPSTNGSNHANGTQGNVKSTIKYTKDTGMTEIYFYESSKAHGIHEPGDDAQEMAFHDGWHRAKEFSYNKEGFQLGEFESDYTAWQDDQRVRESFYPEVVEFLKKTTGAKRILVFDHTIRTKANETKKITDEKGTSQRAPVMLVHCDYTAESGPVRVRQLCDGEADELLKRRVAFFNVWKPLKNVEEMPLAMLDVTSSPPDDFFKLYLRYRERTGENYVMKYNPKHHWWYFPNMTPEQVIILKTFDSETDGRARFVGHTAFEDPTSRKDAPMRESIEIRTIAFY